MKRPALQACALACGRGGRRLFEGVEFVLHDGEALWLTGGNGSGKTSLLRLLAGLGLPLEGEVRWRGRPVRELREDYHRQLLYCGHAAAVKDDLSAWENVAYGAALSGRRIARAQAQAALALAGLEHVTDLPAHALSQGQRRRVALARLHLDPLPPLLLLDEPFTALDKHAVQALGDRIGAHLANGGMAVYTTHQAHGLQPRHQLRLDLDRVRQEAVAQHGVAASRQGAAAQPGQADANSPGGEDGLRTGIVTAWHGAGAPAAPRGRAWIEHRHASARAGLAPGLAPGAAPC